MVGITASSYHRGKGFSTLFSRWVLGLLAAGKVRVALNRSPSMGEGKGAPAGAG